MKFVRESGDSFVDRGSYARSRVGTRLEVIRRKMTRLEMSRLEMIGLLMVMIRMIYALVVLPLEVIHLKMIGLLMMVRVTNGSVSFPLKMAAPVMVA